uniref:Uncharacterized protein n=1 Tax=Acrobeloides nanus TaxID=290746 RepID=A0A914E112_9BILA
MYFSDLDLLSPKQRRSPSFGVDGTDFRMLQALEGSRKPRFGKRAVASFKRTVSNFNDYSIIQAMENIRKPRFGKRSTPVLAKIQSQDQQIFP